ncbi:TIGR02646 family protein [Acinetobacter sp. ACIN00229]|uniref:retron system putative HNH endonuclease n=1 Tax=Acinetobacter sp. ACIN00229 TaxID=2792607 RepID=UPI0018DFF4E7|nr:retron system putative HNH endonuclease [Acinetobacter sp. ACIN00229]MBI0421794.1 TIGR02646 family protein [Acinetobacter sp. ACIN00229]
MKKINKSPPPNPLTEFYDSYEKGSWNDFREHSNSYDRLKELIFLDQGGLCGYCEDDISDLDITKRQIEHFHDKSDKDYSINNWALDWNNVFGVCKGGSDQKAKFPTPQNLSCDAHKNHYLNSPITEGVYLNPLEIPHLAIFSFDRATGFLVPNDEICKLLDDYKPNNYSNFRELVVETIKVLNLNCDRLAQKRRKILFQYNRIIQHAREMNNIQIHEQVAQRWFQKKWPSFFTVRRCLLGEIAEQYLSENGYSSLD